jgi:hypothetical protein
MLGGEFGMEGDPDALAATLREVLAKKGWGQSHQVRGVQIRVTGTVRPGGFEPVPAGWVRRLGTALPVATGAARRGAVG